MVGALDIPQEHDGTRMAPNLALQSKDDNLRQRKVVSCEISQRALIVEKQVLVGIVLS